MNQISIINLRQVSAIGVKTAGIGRGLMRVSVTRRFPVDWKLFRKEVYLLSDRDNRTVSSDEDLSAVNAILGRTEVRIDLDSAALMLLAGNQETLIPFDKLGDS
jgi:hypothetical protein